MSTEYKVVEYHDGVPVNGHDYSFIYDDPTKAAERLAMFRSQAGHCVPGCTFGVVKREVTPWVKTRVRRVKP